MDLIRRMPGGDWIEQDEAWDAWTSRLFSSLQDALASGAALDFDRLRQNLETWTRFIEFDSTGRKWHQWEATKRLLWCAEQAAGLSGTDWDEIDRLRLALADAPDEVKGREGWAMECIRLLRGRDSPARSLQVPIALSDEELPLSNGILAILVIETLRPGGGQVFLHPADTLRTYPHPDFEDAMAAAWEAARALARAQGVDMVFDARWRLLLGGHPIEEIRGRSAGGAAALGWYHALRGTLPDERVIVLAQVDRGGRLAEVAGVEAKVRAIAADGRFDTVVVVGEENRRQAEEALRALGRLEPIRVVNLGLQAAYSG